MEVCSSSRETAIYLKIAELDDIFFYLSRPIKRTVIFFKKSGQMLKAAINSKIAGGVEIS